MGGNHGHVIIGTYIFLKKELRTWQLAVSMFKLDAIEILNLRIQQKSAAFWPADEKFY